MFPEFLLTYHKDFSKSRLKTILKDLDENAKSVDGDTDFELYNYISQVRDRVIEIKGKDTHKTKAEIENEIFKEMEYNFQVVHGKREFLALEKHTTVHIENIKSKYKRINDNNVQSVWDTIEIGRSSVELYNLEILHGSYVSSKMNKEFDNDFAKKYNFSKTTQSKYIKQVLDEKSIEAFTKSNGKNKSEIKIHPYVESLKSEKCIENTKHLTQSKLSNMKNLPTLKDYNDVLSGKDKAYDTLKKKQKKARDQQIIKDEKAKIKEEYESIESSLSNEIYRLEINLPTLTQEEYKSYRQMDPKELIFDLLKDKYKLYQEKELYKSKYESQVS